MADKESHGTVLLAGTANLAIAIAKVVAGLLSGSTALLAEAAHSVADTLNQVFLPEPGAPAQLIAGAFALLGIAAWRSRGIH